MSLVPTCRLFTGRNRFRAYVRDTETGRNVMACDHKHVSRFKTTGKNGEYYAMRCARKMLKTLLAAPSMKAEARCEAILTQSANGHSARWCMVCGGSPLNAHCFRGRYMKPEKGES